MTRDRITQMSYVLLFIFLNMAIATIQAQNPPNETELFPYRISDGFVFVDTNSNVVIKHKYSFAKPFDKGIAIVTSDNHEGVINHRGEWILKPEYNHIRIIQVGNTQLIATAQTYTTSHEMHRWRLMPNASVFGYKPPFIARKVAHTKWQVFDRSGHKLWTEDVREDYDDATNTVDHKLSDPPLHYLHHNNMVYVYTDKTNVKTYRIKGDRLVYNNSLKNVHAITQDGYLSRTDNGVFDYLDYNNKVIEPGYSFVRNFSEIAYQPTDDNFPGTIWMRNDKYFCIDETSRKLIPLPEVVMNKAESLIVPLDSLGNRFWINIGKYNTGVIDKKGNWMLTGDNVFFDATYGDRSVQYRSTDPKRNYFLLKDDKNFAFPKGAYPTSRVKGMTWIVEAREGNESKYGVYDLARQKWLMQPGEFIQEITPEYFSIEEKQHRPGQSGYDHLYSVVDLDKQKITQRGYRSISATCDKRMVLVWEHDSNSSFYVKVSTGEELRQ